ncbi:MAG TPA: Mur ligase domain-containing protein, partial [Terriglobia bacterium]|nr:Mur ligase domain-containing protein [Terriglobia bacterium]
MNLDALLRDTEVLNRSGGTGREVLGLAHDSRQVKPGWLFFAIQGEHADGHRFIDELIRGGAAGVVSERPAPENFPAVWIQVRAIRRAMAEIGRAFYDYPDLKLKLVGITGTNGKTTTSHLLHSIFQAAGYKTGLFGTIEYRLNGRILPA